MFVKFIAYIKGKLSNDVSTKKLKELGLTVGDDFSRQEGCIIDHSYCWLITIGNSVTLAPRVHILAHDASTKMFLGYTKIGKVTIGNRVFIGAGSIILPDVKIGNNVIIGAGSIVSEDIPNNSLAVGNPAKVIGSVDEYLNKNEKLMKESPRFENEYTLNGGITVQRKKEMNEKLKQDIGYII